MYIPTTQRPLMCWTESTFKSPIGEECRQTISGAIKKAMSALRQLFRNRKLSRKLKTEFVLKCVFPALFYSCETWRTTTVLIRRLETHLNSQRSETGSHWERAG